MSVLSPIDFSFVEAHRLATKEANCWRGRAINWFARAEGVVMLALIEAGVSAKAQHPLSHKLDRLEKVMAGQQAVLNAITDFRAHLELRNTIVHCESRVFADSKGNWLLQFEDHCGQVCRRISEPDGEVLRRALQQSVDRLRSALAVKKQSSDRADTPSA